MPTLKKANPNPNNSSFPGTIIHADVLEMIESLYAGGNSREFILGYIRKVPDFRLSQRWAEYYVDRAYPEMHSKEPHAQIWARHYIFAD